MFPLHLQPGPQSPWKSVGQDPRGGYLLGCTVKYVLTSYFCMGGGGVSSGLVDGYVAEWEGEEVSGGSECVNIEYIDKVMYSA